MNTKQEWKDYAISCAERIRKLIALDAPDEILDKEIAMLQTRIKRMRDAP